MASSFDGPNPYESPAAGPGSAATLRASVKGKVAAPAICLIVVACLGLVLSILNTIVAVVSEPQPIDPNAPEFVREFQQGQTGPMAVAIQTVFIVVNAVIIFGGIQMLRMRSWGMSLAAAILAMINLGTCCCLLGIPVGIWSIVILVGADVKAAFAASAAPAEF